MLHLEGTEAAEDILVGRGHAELHHEDDATARYKHHRVVDEKNDGLCEQVLRAADVMLVDGEAERGEEREGDAESEGRSVRS